MWIPLVSGNGWRTGASAPLRILLFVAVLAAVLAPASVLADTYDTATLVNIETAS
jgi:hypothetical protein